jgi:hypothetical protein
MNDCEALVDLMPMVAAGRAAWPAGAEAHLRNCADCQAAWRLIGAAARLGGQAPQAIDFDAVAAGVSGRLRAARRSDRRRRGLGGVTLLAAAAAVALIVWRGHPATVAPGPEAGTLTPGAQALVIPVSGLDDLDAGQLQAIDRQLDGPLGTAGSVGGPALEELSPEEMSQVLSTYQG